ncbi:hypothetical protein KI387_024405, partial [Taxus chinensis]
ERQNEFFDLKQRAQKVNEYRQIFERLNRHASFGNQQKNGNKEFAKKSPNEIKCWNCGENHYAKGCPQTSKGWNKNDIKNKKHYSNKNQQNGIDQKKDKTSTMKIHAAVDTGSSHSFISPNIVSKLNFSVREIEPIAVEMADGRIIRHTGAMIEDLKIQLDDLDSCDHFHLLKLGQYDAILGMT